MNPTKIFFFGKYYINSSLVLIPILSGVISAASFILSWAPLFFLGTFLFVYSLSNKTYKVADVVGFSYGVGYYTVGLFWLFVVEDAHQAENLYVLYGLVFVAIFLLAIPFSISAVLITLVPTNRRSTLTWSILVVVPILVLHEWFKTWYFSGFPWLQASHLFVDPFYGGWFAILGDVGSSFFIYFLISIAVYASMVMYQWQKILAVCVPMLLLFILVTMLVGKVDYNMITDIESLQVQIINDQHVQNNNYDARLKRIRVYQKTAELGEGVDISIWPESSTGGVFGELEKDTLRGFDILEGKNIEVFFGGYTREGLSVHNSIISSRKMEAVYTKQHLVPVGEYMPSWFSLLDSLIPSLYNDSVTYSNPKLSQSFRYKNIGIAPMICYEVLFGDELRKRAKQANILFYISNLEEIRLNWVKEYFFKVARVRAMELQKPLIQSTNMGVSAFISDKGEIIKTASTKQISIISRVQPKVGDTPFSRFGYFLIVGISIFMLLCAYVLVFFRGR